MSAAQVERVVIRRGVYHDPSTLLRGSDRGRSVKGVSHVAAGMYNPLNRHVIEGRHGYFLPEDEPTPDDLVIGVRADSEEAADAAIAAVERHLAEHEGEREVAAVGAYEWVGKRGRPSGRPPAFDGATLDEAQPALDRLAANSERIARANDEAVKRMHDARALLVGVARAGDVLTEMTPRTILHAGPPIAWPDMSGPLRGAIIGALLHERLASDPEDAARRAERGEFEFTPGHERGALGPMTGVISPSMPVWIVEDEAHGHRAHCNFSEGLGQMLRFGAYDEVVLERLEWMRDLLAPVMAKALEGLVEPIDLRDIVVRAVHMGDEGHNRVAAGNSLFIRALVPALVEIDEDSRIVGEIVQFMDLSDYFFLNLSMLNAKVTTDAAAGIEHSTIVTAMARNGTEFGLRVSGTGDCWFTAPSAAIDACYLPGYTSEDANLDMGDSTITETIGLGGFALAAAPAIGSYVGTSAEDAIRATLEMYEITWTESGRYRIPALGFRGVPLGIDCRRVVHSGIRPLLDTGIAHREAGVGVVGGGVVRAPIEPFAAATRALADAS